PVAMASLLKHPIDPELTLVALRKLAPIPGVRHPIAIRDVVETVSTYFKKPPDELAAPRRARSAPARDVPQPPVHGRDAVGDRRRAGPRPLGGCQCGAQGGAPDPGKRTAPLSGGSAVRAARWDGGGAPGVGRPGESEIAARGAPPPPAHLLWSRGGHLPDRSAIDP